MEFTSLCRKLSRVFSAKVFREIFVRMFDHFREKNKRRSVAVFQLLVVCLAPRPFYFDQDAPQYFARR